MMCLAASNFFEKLLVKGYWPETTSVFDLPLESSERPDLQSRLNSFRFRFATDARDHVFGLLGTVEEPKRLIKPDYSLSIFDVFQKTAAEIIFNSRTVKLFVDTWPSIRAPGLPSWVPDWSQKPASTWSIRFFDYYGAFQCNTRAEPWFFPQGIIGLEGASLGSIKQLFVFPREIGYQEDFEEAYRTFFMAERRYRTMIASHAKRSGKLKGNDELWRLCTMDIDLSTRDNHARRLSPSDYSNYTKWREFFQHFIEQPTQEAKAEFNKASFASNTDLEAIEAVHVQFWEHCTFFVLTVQIMKIIWA